MSATHRKWSIALGLMLSLALVLACSAPGRILGDSPLATLVEALPADETEPDAGLPPVESTASEPLVVTHQGDSFNIHSLDGALVETRPADGLDYARPNTAQVVGETIYYVDSAGSSLGGVVRRVTSSGVETLDFTAGEEMASVTFAVSADESRIAWTHSTYGTAGVVSQLWIANADGTDARLVLESSPSDGIEEYYALEAVRWEDGDLIYAWQVTGIGGYILFFGWSSFYRYSPADGTSTPLVAVNAEGAGPCWYAVSPDGMYAVGGCGEGGMKERELGGGTETAFPVQPDEAQQGGASYSPSGERLAYAVARGNPEDESGQVLVRLSPDQEPFVLSTQTPGYFERTLWADEGQIVVGYASGESSAVDLLNVDGARTPIGGGRLIGLTQPAPAAAASAGLAAQVGRGELEIVRVVANGEIAGPGIRVVVRNPGPEDIETFIPCGLFFEPDDSSDQRLMVVQPVSAIVPAGGEVELTAFVVCIDSTSATPDDGATYALGAMETGDLLKLAQCACGEDLSGEEDFMAGFGIMLAGWSISSGQTVDEMQAEGGEGAMGDAFAGGMGDLLGLLGGFSSDWFEKCEIPRP